MDDTQNTGVQPGTAPADPMAGNTGGMPSVIVPPVDQPVDEPVQTPPPPVSQTPEPTVPVSEIPTPVTQTPSETGTDVPGGGSTPPVAGA
jgi:hypothetical protein